GGSPASGGGSPVSGGGGGGSAAAAPVAVGPVAVDDDGWALDVSESPAGERAPGQSAVGSAVGAPGAVAPASAITQMPSPAAAAYEAARIVGEIVGDIESAPGAPLMSAAAAGAAIEVARARVAAGETERALAGTPPADPANADPVT